MTAGLLFLILILGGGAYLVMEHTGFIIALLACIPFAIIISVIATVHEKHYNEGTRPVDKLIRKTQLIAVNGVEQTTYPGALSRAIVGHELAGDWGALLGAMSAKETHVDNEFTFLVFYSKEKTGNKREIEKVKQSSGRFKFLVSKLEGNEQEKPKTKKSASYSKQKQLSSDAGAKTVHVPVGEYIVGEDIPAGSYSLESDEFAAIWLYKNADDDSGSDNYDCEEPHFSVGKIVLKKGMRVRIDYGDVLFSKYDRSRLWERLNSKRPATVFVGEYKIGKDIPAGAYTLTSDRFCCIWIYNDDDPEDYGHSFDCDEPNYTIGKVTLKDGMRITVKYCAMRFEPYKGLGF